ncbi:MAG: glucose-6-phosphate isomerase, partial [Candidatus Krumholzibacteriota bacterium]|nr:glucose-6-phosphate isomerase [Candidatus Krumholzibacteriota bacterium]
MITLDISDALPHIGGGGIKKEIPRALQALRALLGRNGPGADMLGWLDLPRMPQRDIESISDLGKRIQDRSDCLVVVGIGGSYLGARAAIEALSEEAVFPVHFAGFNLSPTYHDKLIASLEGKKFTLCVISKSGTTTEPAVAFRLLRRRLLETVGPEGLKDRIIAITDPRRGALRLMAEAEGWKSLAIPPDVGGRFSILSPVGLFPCAAAGIPVKDMLAGAAAAQDRFTRPQEGNPALEYALVRTMLHQKGTFVEVLSTFHPELALFGEWWKQLSGESEGKAGRGLFPACAVMTTDLHSLGQLLQEGPRGILETFLVAARPRRDLAIPAWEENPDDLNYIAGKSLGEVNRRAFEGTRKAHAAGGLPLVTMEIPSLTPPSLGELFFFFEIAVSLSGYLLEV